MTTGEIIQEEAAFSSQVEENLAEADEAELFQDLNEVALESMANLQRMGSNWTSVSVI